MKSFFKSWKSRIVLLLAVIGPGFITANVDNDAGGIFTYSLAGAQFGYRLLWLMIPLTISLALRRPKLRRIRSPASPYQFARRAVTVVG